jgi:PUA-domain protein
LILKVNKNLLLIKKTRIFSVYSTQPKPEKLKRTTPFMGCGYRKQMKRKRLKSKEVNRELADYNLELSKKDSVELIEEGKLKILSFNGEGAFFDHENKWSPTLKYLQSNELLKKIVVDMGAVKFVVNGADIMRPGIVEIEEGVKEGDFVVVVDVENGKPLIVGVALFGSEEMQEKSEGKVIKNIHYVGDEIWRMK